MTPHAPSPPHGASPTDGPHEAVAAGTPVTRPARRVRLIITATGVLAGLCLLSLAVGSRAIPLDQVTRSLLDPDHSGLDAEVVAIVRGTRLIRTLVAVLAGAALGLAGAVMQGLTRNPLADPGLLGVSAGAAFGTVTATGVLGVATLTASVWFALAGAAIASCAVYLLGSRGTGGASPVKLALAGVAVTYLLDSLTSGVALTDPEALDRYRYWSSGSLTGHDGDTLLGVAPFLAAGALVALSTAPALNSLSLGDDVAVALGHRLGLIRLGTALAVTLLTGATVAVTGPIVFVGLVVPHLVRMITGPDHRWLLPGAMLVAPCLLLAADIIGRVVARPQEIDVSLVAAFLGAPFFIALVRRRRLAEL
ncbi:iron complex transport system permease protein [Streptosporangium becharense]|uniref:Iron complex transport system permease protein n=1 Tax=Streptosporangium becharense TaxID=1816182 RepID=A0A7W9IHJ9_9ACTN|nr:iron chelate uptake ABC transporter family permease subunit [Streptosporangium becharense]MBB2912755.1 iron complex transport system permease protein [Streptosporangium becharense]MBB5820416.1 iron complex transport system permease protein [Streptosporangium becharense]